MYMIHLKIGLGSVSKMYVFAALTHAHDTQLFKSAENIYQVELAINADLKKVNEWYEFNQMKRNWYIFHWYITTDSCNSQSP